MSQSSTVEAIVRGVHFTDESLRSQFSFNADLGFVAVHDAVDRAGEVTVLGFGGTSAQDMSSLPAVKYSVAELAQVPLADQTVDKQGKGVGLRLYNSPHALAGLADAPADAPDRVAAYMLTLDTRAVLDTRTASDRTLTGKAQRIARHFGRMVFSHTETLEVLTTAIHESYGAADAVLFSQPPRARLRELTRGVRPPVPSRFLVVRNPNLPAQGVGLRGPLW